MRVLRISTLDELARFAEPWDRLSCGIPFRSWAWMSSWWRHYGERGGPGGRTRLMVLCVLDTGNELLGAAPWYLDVSASRGRVVRFLGTGTVCSEYLGVLCHSGLEERVTETLADWLAEKHGTGRATDHQSDQWDLLEWTDVDAQDHVVALLADHLAERGNRVHRRAGHCCWRIELPTSWNEYLASLSKNRRKKTQRTIREMFDTRRAVLHTVQTTSELARTMDLLIDLHGRRRRLLGEPGVFASGRFTTFHREVTEQMLRAGQLQMHWLELDGKPAAVDYHLSGDGVIYAYQGGFEPDLLDLAPGRLITIATIRWAIEHGYRAFDLLRGEELYKTHWRAEPRRGLEFRVVANRAAAQLRHRLWLAGCGTKQWMRDCVDHVRTPQN